MIVSVDYVLLRDSSERFITQDAPVQIHKIDEPSGCALYFPLTPRTAILFVPRLNGPMASTVDVTDDVVAYFNKYYFSDECLADLCIDSSEVLLQAYL